MPRWTFCATPVSYTHLDVYKRQEGNHTVAYAMVGMAAFFAVAAQAPLTALVMVVEFSMSCLLYTSCLRPP